MHHYTRRTWKLRAEAYQCARTMQPCYNGGMGLDGLLMCPMLGERARSCCIACLVLLVYAAGCMCAAQCSDNAHRRMCLIYRCMIRT